MNIMKHEVPAILQISRGASQVKVLKFVFRELLQASLSFIRT